MSEKKFEMRQSTSSGYDIYYPRTTIDQVIELQSELNDKVDLASNQTVTGEKTFTSQATFRSSTTNQSPMHIKYNNSVDGSGGIWSTVFDSTEGGWVDSQIHFPNGGEGQYDIRFPNKSGTLATTDDAGGGIVDVETLPEITEDNSRSFAREDYIELSYPKGTNIIEGEGERDLNTDGNTGNKGIQYLIDDFNGMGREWIDEITLDESQGYLRGSNPPSFKPFWTIAGYDSSGERAAHFVLDNTVTSFTLYMTTGFSVAAGGQYEGLIPADYPEIYVSNTLTESTTSLDSVAQGDDPNEVTIYAYTIQDDNGFDEFSIEWLNSEGTTQSSTKINIYKVEAVFADGSTVYKWSRLAETSYVDAQDTVLSNQITSEESARTAADSALDTRVTTNESDISALEDYVGEIQIEHVTSSLPTAGEQFLMKLFRYQNNIYQCLKSGSQITLDGSFSTVTGTSLIVPDSCNDIELPAWNNNLKITSVTKAYRDNGKLKLSSSSAVGSITLSVNNSELPLKSVKITVAPYSSSKPSIVTVKKVVNSVQTVLHDKIELTEETELECTSLTLNENDSIIIMSDSSQTSQERRLYIKSVACVLGSATYTWSDICHGGSGGGSSNIFINPYNTDNVYVIYKGEDEDPITCSWDSDAEWFVDENDKKVPEKDIFNKNKIYLLAGTKIKNETTDNYINLATLSEGSVLIPRYNGIPIPSMPALTLQYKIDFDSTAAYQFIPLYANSAMIMPRISPANVYCEKFAGSTENRVWDEDRPLYFTIRVDEGEVFPGDEITIGVMKYTGFGKNHTTAYHRYRVLYRYTLEESDLDTHYYKNQRLIRISVNYDTYFAALRRTYDAGGNNHNKVIRIGRPIYKGGNLVDTIYSNNVVYRLLFYKGDSETYVRAHLD